MAISSKGTPPAAAAWMARAISTHSSASPEVEKMTTLPSSSRAGTASLEKRYRCREPRQEAGSAPPGSRCNSSAACAAAITEASSSRSSRVRGARSSATTAVLRNWL